MIWALSSVVPDDGGITDIIKNTNFPGVILLALASVPALFFLVRWMVQFQRQFTDFYIQENIKLRTQVTTLENEVRSKDDEIVELKTTVGKLENEVQKHEDKIEALTKIIDRRRLKDDTGGRRGVDDSE